MMHEIALSVGRQLWINVTVNDQQIHPTIVVIIKEFCSPTDVGQTYGSHLGRIRNIRKGTVSIVVVESVIVVIEISNEQVQFAIVIIVTQGNPHATLLAAVLIYCCA